MGSCDIVQLAPRHGEARGDVDPLWAGGGGGRDPLKLLELANREPGDVLLIVRNRALGLHRDQL